jgi:hypothetical protein
MDRPISFYCLALQDKSIGQGIFFYTGWGRTKLIEPGVIKNKLAGGSRSSLQVLRSTSVG